MSVNLQGAILDLITDLFIVNDGFSAGEKLTQIEKTAKKRFYSMTDTELYEALNNTVKEDYFSDTMHSEEELKEI